MCVFSVDNFPSQVWTTSTTTKNQQNFVLFMSNIYGRSDGPFSFKLLMWSLRHRLLSILVCRNRIVRYLMGYQKLFAVQQISSTFDWKMLLILPVHVRFNFFFFFPFCLSSSSSFDSVFSFSLVLSGLW